MKVAYINFQYDIQGAAKGSAVQIEAIAQGLRHLGHDVEVTFLAARQVTAKQHITRLKGVGWLRRYAHVPRLLLRNIRYTYQLLHLFRTSRPDVILALNSLCNFSAVLAGRLVRVPLVLFCEEPSEYEYALLFPHYHVYPRLARCIEGINLRAAQQVICISEILRAYFFRYGVQATRIHVVPNGVDHRLINPQPPDRELVERFSLRDRLSIGFVGSFNFFPRVEDFVQASLKITREFPRVVFLFVGEGVVADRLRDVAASHQLTEQFVFAGRVPHDQVSRYLSAMDIVIALYRGDYLFYGSPMKLLEYMAAGKPTVAPALGQIKELMSDGYNALLYEPDDFRQMVHKVQMLIEDPGLRRELGLNARKTIEGNWTWDLQASRINAVLKLALEKHSTHSSKE